MLSRITVLAQNTTKWEDYTTSSGQSCVTHGDVATIQGLECLFYNILQIITYIAGIVFIIMFIRGGFSYLFSGGDPKKNAQSSATLTMSVIGLIGIIASWLVLRLIHQFTGVDVTNFVIPYTQ